MPHRDSAKASLRTLRLLCALCVPSFLFVLVGCGHRNANDPSSLTFLIESNPTNLDPRFDELVDQIRTETDREKRKALCSEVQKILADDLPYLPLWFTDVVSTGDFDFLAMHSALR